jgi:hypothetical protein
MSNSRFSSAIRLIEDALVLVRRADATTWLVYLCGVVPFFGVLAFELTDLARNPFVSDQIVGLSFVLAILYLWLHICQSVFSIRLYDTLTEEIGPLRSQFAAAARVQIALAGTKLIAWPIGFCLLIPHTRITMFYQHSLLPKGDSKPANWRSTSMEASQDAHCRQGEAVWFLVTVLLLRVILAINLFVLLFMLPALWKILTGFEGNITRWPSLLANPTALGAICILAYLGLDPVVKAACVQRRFERQSQRSGHDLRLRLRVWQRSAVSVLLLAGFCFSWNLTAATKTSSPASSTVTPDRMNSAIHSVFHDPANTWNLPVVETGKQAKNPVFVLMDSLVNHAGKIWKGLKEWLNRLFKSNTEPSDLSREYAPASSSDVWLLLGLFACMLGLTVLFAWWKRGKVPAPQPAEPSAAAASIPIDLNSEEIQPDDRPEDEWLKLAREHRVGGNFRLSLRALYLSSLASLAGANLISVGRGKSNLDYLRELQRRGKRLTPEVITVFYSNLGVFEQSWYGTKTVNEQLLDSFQKNLDLLRDGVTSRRPISDAAPASRSVSTV